MMHASSTAAADTYQQLQSDAEAMTLAAGEFVKDMPPEMREAALWQLLRIIARIYKEHGAEPPAWLAKALTLPIPHAAVLDSGTDQDGSDGHDVFMHFIEIVVVSDMARLTMRRRVRAHRRGMRGVAAEIGLSEWKFKRFLRGEMLEAATWDAITEDVLAHAGGSPPSPAILGIALTVSVLPLAWRTEARQCLADALGRFYLRKRAEIPEWLEEEELWP
jgi:hypothetical protein